MACAGPVAPLWRIRASCKERRPTRPAAGCEPGGTACPTQRHSRNQMRRRNAGCFGQAEAPAPPSHTGAVDGRSTLRHGPHSVRTSCARSRRRNTWKVRDVAAHLLDTALRKLSVVRDGCYVEAPAITPPQDLVNLVNRLNREGVTVYRRLSPAVLIDLMEAACEQA